MKPLLSILIATKNRQRYCLSAVESILEIGNENIQVVVQDNSDDTSLKNMLHSFFEDKRLVYRYTPPPFSSIDNFNAALELATGEYVCLIGDDDGINPEIITATLWAKQNDIDCLVGNLAANYRWEGTGAPDTLFTKMTGSTLTLTHFNGKAKKVNIQDSFERFKKNGCTNYLEFSFPKLYHGVVRRALFEKIKEKTGSYIKGLSPDIYTAMALSIFAKKIIEVDYPLTIPGVCGQSTSVTEGQIKKHSKKLEDAPHFRDRKEPYSWAKPVPRIYCVQTIWADSAFAAMNDLGYTSIFDGFDKYMLCANILDADSTLREMVWDYLKQNFQESDDVLNKNLKMAYLKGPMIKFFHKRVFGRAKKILKIERFEVLSNISDMTEAKRRLSIYLDDIGIDLVQELDKAL